MVQYIGQNQAYSEMVLVTVCSIVVPLIFSSINVIIAILLNTILAEKNNALQ